jgi:RNA polymerase sigma factor (sigma-70 family)
MRDEEILQKSVENPRLFGVLVDRYQTAFVRKAFTIVRNEAEAEDIAQETFTKIYLHANKFQKMEGIEFKSWAWRILVNTALTHYRKLKRSFGDVTYLDEILQNGEDAEAGLPIENNIDRESYYREIREAVDELPEEAARLLRAHYLEDRPYEEIATSEGVSLGALKMKLFRARKVLKDILETRL